jgi:hypothetical protein
MMTAMMRPPDGLLITLVVTLIVPTTASCGHRGASSSATAFAAGSVLEFGEHEHE